MAYLLLVRHGVTDWNKIGRWHGQTDIPLSVEGRQQARQDANVLKAFTIDKVYTSRLKRTKETFQEINQTLHLLAPVVAAAALNERDYGIYTGRNKWEVEKELGTDRFNQLRRSWDYPIPNGESLKDVYNRVVPYYQDSILPELKAGKNIMLISSGNTLRALTKFLQNLPDQDISNKQLNFGEIDVYTIDPSGQVTSLDSKLTNLFPSKH